MSVAAAPPPPPARGLAGLATRNAAATVAARLSSVVVGLILTPFLLTGMGPALYGVAIATGSAYDYLSLLRGGIGGALRRFVTVHHHAGRHDEARRTYAAGFWWAMVLRLVILAAGLALAGPLARFLHPPPELIDEATLGVALMLVASVVADAAILLDTPIYATGRTGTLAIAWGVMVWVRLGFAVLAFAVWPPGLATYGVALIATEVVSFALFTALAARTRVVGPVIPPPAFGDAPLRRELFGYGGLAIVAQAAAMLYLTADHLLIGRFFGAAAVATYSFGTRWFPLILGLVVAAIGSLTPLFTALEARGEEERSRAALERLVAVATAIAVPVCLAPCILGDRFLAAWVGPEYAGASAYLVALLVPLTLEAALAPVWMALNARGRIGWIATSNLLVALAKVALSLVLALTLNLGLLGFALANTVALVAKNLLVLALLARRREPGFPPVGALLRPLLPALAGGAPGLIALYLVRDALGTGLLPVMAAGALGGALSLAGSALAALGPRGLRELAGAARRRSR